MRWESNKVLQEAIEFILSYMQTHTPVKDETCERGKREGYELRDKDEMLTQCRPFDLYQFYAQCKWENI